MNPNNETLRVVIAENPRTNVQINIAARDHIALREAIENQRKSNGAQEVEASKVVDALLDVYIQKGIPLPNVVLERQNILRHLLDKYKDKGFFAIKTLVQKNDVEVFFWSLERGYLDVAIRLVNTLSVNIEAADHRVLWALVNRSTGDMINVGKKVIDIYFQRDIATPKLPEGNALSQYINQKNQERAEHARGAVLLKAVEVGDLERLMRSVCSEDEHVLKQHGMRVLQLAITQLNLAALAAKDTLNFSGVDKYIGIVRYLLRFEAIQQNIDHQDHAILRLVQQNVCAYSLPKIGEEILKIYFLKDKYISLYVIEGSFNNELANYVKDHERFRSGVNNGVRVIKEAKSQVDSVAAEVAALNPKDAESYRKTKEAFGTMGYGCGGYVVFGELLSAEQTFREHGTLVQQQDPVALLFNRHKQNSNLPWADSILCKNVLPDVICAIGRRDIRSVAALLGAGRDACNTLGSTLDCSEAMKKALECGYPDMAVFLYKYATTRGFNARCDSALLIIAKAGDIDFLKQLQSNGIPIVYDDLKLALSAAVENGHVAFIEYLVSKPEVQSYLMDKNNFSSYSSYKINPLKILEAVATGGKLEILELLVPFPGIRESLTEQTLSRLFSGNFVVKAKEVLQNFSESQILNEKMSKLFSPPLTSMCFQYDAIRVPAARISEIILGYANDEMAMTDETATRQALDF